MCNRMTPCNQYKNLSTFEKQYIIKLKKYSTSFLRDGINGSLRQGVSMRSFRSELKAEESRVAKWNALAIADQAVKFKDNF